MPGAQAELRKEAAASAIEEQLKDKEATEADNAANLAKLAEHEALVRPDARLHSRLAHADVQSCLDATSAAAQLPQLPSVSRESRLWRACVHGSAALLTARLSMSDKKAMQLKARPVNVFVCMTVPQMCALQKPMRGWPPHMMRKIVRSS